RRLDTECSERPWHRQQQGAGGGIFRDRAAAAAMTDSMVYHANVLTLKGASYRLRADVASTASPASTPLPISASPRLRNRSLRKCRNRPVLECHPHVGRSQWALRAASERAQQPAL